MTTVTVSSRFSASALMRSIWWLLPSTSATQVRPCRGSRRSASSKTRVTTSAASSATLAVTHLPVALGCWWHRGAIIVFGGEHVGGGAGDGLEVVDRSHLGHNAEPALMRNADGKRW